MNERGWYIFFGLVSAIVAGLIIWPADTGTMLAEVSDVLYELGTDETERFGQLKPEVQTQLQALIIALRAQGIAVFIGSTLRDSAAQAQAYDAGNSSNKVSWHQLGRAVDLYPIDPATGSPDRNGRNLDLFRAMHETAAQAGWRGLAFNDDGSKRLITNKYGKKVWDGAHLEWRDPYASLSEAVSAEGIV